MLPKTYPPKDEAWFQSIKWDQPCIDCHKKNSGNCPKRSCAELHYDYWGDPIPAYLYYPDGNDVEKYLQRKAVKMQACN